MIKLQDLISEAKIDPTQGKEVFQYLKKLGNENHDDDPLDDIRREVESSQYILKEVPISKLLKSDRDLNDYVQSELRDFRDDWKKRPVKAPILVSKRGKVQDGYHRTTQEVVNGKSKIKAFVEI